MSYCRFRNTLGDLRDCLDNMFTNDLSREEAEARKDMVQAMYIFFVEQLGVEIEEDDNEILSRFDQKITDEEFECESCGVLLKEKDGGRWHDDQFLCGNCWPIQV